MQSNFETKGISIIICSRGRRESLSRSIRGLSEMIETGEIDWELVIVDNNEIPLVGKLLERQSTKFPVRCLHEPVAGLSRARNRALSVVDTDRHTIWTDDDVVVSSTWLSVYERAFRYWPDFDFFGGPITARFEGGQQPTWVESALQICPEVFASINPVNEFVELDSDAVFFPFGANMAFRSGILNKLRFCTALGRQPGSITRGGEEMYLIRELVAQGSKGLWLPPANVEHWIDPARQTIKHVYDHTLGNALIDELIDVDCDIDQLVSGLLDADLYPIQGDRAFIVNDVDASDRLSELKLQAISHGRELAKRLVPDHFRYQKREHRNRLLVLGLDGFVPWIADKMIDNGELPNFKLLRDTSARFELDHGDAMFTGLAWEHFSGGRSPDDYDRHAAVYFDQNSYQVWQYGTKSKTFVHGMSGHAVVFDVPYFDILGSPQISGLTNWGSHDPGVAKLSKPMTLSSEIRNRFGEYPAHRWIYGFTWPSPDNTSDMARKLEESVERRSEILPWLLNHRFPDWTLSMTTVSEFHSACEAFWHGIDPAHLLYRQSSAPHAEQGLKSIYRATDRMIGTIRQSLPNLNLLLFSMHGMGANNSDVPAMLLLPELLFRHAFGTAAFTPDEGWSQPNSPIPLLRPDMEWSESINACINLRGCGSDLSGRNSRSSNLDFMPAARYQPVWHLMDAFALPSFYDGRIRFNLKDRERNGRVASKDWEAWTERMARLLEECRDTLTGKQAVESINVNHLSDPLKLGPTDCDMRVRWKPNILGWSHPKYGQIGPAPFRRPGGHGGPGCAWIASEGIASGDYGRRSSFDVVPTILDLLNDKSDIQISGRSMLKGLCT